MKTCVGIPSWSVKFSNKGYCINLFWGKRNDKTLVESDNHRNDLWLLSKERGLWGKSEKFMLIQSFLENKSQFPTS